MEQKIPRFEMEKRTFGSEHRVGIWRLILPKSIVPAEEFTQREIVLGYGQEYKQIVSTELSRLEGMGNIARLRKPPSEKTVSYIRMNPDWWNGVGFFILSLDEMYRETES